MTEIDDISIIQEISKGNVNAFAHIVKRYQSMVYSIVYRVTANTDESKDITQEIFIKIFESLGQFKSDAKFSTWVYRVAFNTTISLLRKKKHYFYDIQDVTNEIPDVEDDGMEQINKKE